MSRLLVWQWHPAMPAAAAWSLQPLHQHLLRNLCDHTVQVGSCRSFFGHWAGFGHRGIQGRAQWLACNMSFVTKRDTVTHCLPPAVAHCQLVVLLSATHWCLLLLWYTSTARAVAAFRRSYGMHDSETHVTHVSHCSAWGFSGLCCTRNAKSLLVLSKVDIVAGF